MPTPTTKSYSHTVALDGRNDLKLYKNLARMLFALETRFRISDIHTTAADAVTDGGDDKKCDMVYIDRDTGEVVIAQSYHSQKEQTMECLQMTMSQRFLMLLIHFFQHHKVLLSIDTY